jgi:hypothetical protein
MQELATKANVPADLQEKVLITGDLAKLSIPERLSYYKAVCESVGLNPLTRPFEYIVLDDRLVLYARKDCTDQLRELHGVSLEIASREKIDDLFVVTARAKNMMERIDESIGAVPAVKEDGEWKTTQSGKRYFQGNGTYKPLALDARANAMMKAETKAKRRVTLSICGLGMLDESEIDSIPNAKRAVHAEDPDRKYTRAELVNLTHPQSDTAAGEDGGTTQSLHTNSAATTSNQDAPLPSSTDNLFDQSSAEAEHNQALTECHNMEELQKVWDECVRDKRLTSESRPQLYELMKRIEKKIRARK